MSEPLVTGSHARLRIWLALGYALFIIYSSLSPFSGWREQGLNFVEMLQVPLRLTYTTFDATLNFLSYLPLGLLVALALRARTGAALSIVIGTATGLLLSASMEYLQMYLPTRFSSNTDILSNSCGMFTGTLVAAGLASHPLVIERLELWRIKLFFQGKDMDFGLALLTLWIFGQLNPSLPLLGNVFISEVARQPFVTIPSLPFDGWESIAVTLNLLMLSTLLLTVLRKPRHVIASVLMVLSLVILVKFVSAAILLRSWALLVWINSEAILGMLLGIALMIGQLKLSRTAAIRAGTFITLGYLLIINFVFDGNAPSAAMSVYHWHYGHLLTYNGLAQTILLVFPVLLLFHLWRVRHTYNFNRVPTSRSR
ncbi:MAG: VanZ family protein [Gallionella sp.]